MDKSSVRQRDSTMGKESIRRSTEAKNKVCFTFAIKNRYKMVSRLLHERYLYFYQRSVEVWWGERVSSVPVLDSYF